MYSMVSSCAPGGPKSLLIMKYVGHLSNQTHASYGETVTPGGSAPPVMHLFSFYPAGEVC